MMRVPRGLGAPMRPSPQDRAIIVCAFIRSYNDVWSRHFPGAVERGHWAMLLKLRLREREGILFSKLRKDMGSIFGMDNATCAFRLKQLIGAGLVEHDGERIGAATCVRAKPPLIDRFDRHTIESVQLLHGTAKALEPRLPRLPALQAGGALNKRFVRFFEDFNRNWGEHREEFLRINATLIDLRSEKHREAATKNLKMQPYWNIFLKAWLHRHPQTVNEPGYLLISRIQRDMPEDLGAKAVTSYVQNMIDYGFLERLRKEAGVPRNKFAVRMTKPAFEHFSFAFADSAPLLIDSAREFCRLGAETSAKVLRFPTPEQNVSGTPTNPE
jgi:hypothetical protein